MKLSILDTLVFLAYFFGTVFIAITIARRQKGKTSSSYFLASRGLPWYAVGASIIAVGVSTEHFIGTVGWAYIYGMAVANWQWGAIITYSILIWIFLPFYMRGNVSTMPEFLERRYNSTCRYIYALVSIVGMVIAMLGGVMYAGAKTINVLFPQLNIPLGIIILALAVGIYTVYGGLLSAAWADVLQYILLMLGGLVVTFYGLSYVGGVDNLLKALPEKAIMIYPANHEAIPWTGLLATFLSVGVWYNCANQFIVQRCLAARSEWDARMGVIMAGFTMLLLPLLIVVPGLIAFYMFSDRLSDGDQSWPLLVSRFLPSGLVGLVLAGLSSAIMSTLSAILNASATIFTLDLYKPLIRPNSSDRQLRLVGRLSTAGFLVIGIAIALLLAAIPGLTVFGIIQTVFFYVAAPITAVFFVGILWRRATPAAATLTMYIGFAMIPVVRFGLFRLPALQPYDSFTHHTFAVFLISIALVIGLSFVTRPKPAEELDQVIWDRSALKLPASERQYNRGLRNFILWWALMGAINIGLYIYTNTRSSGTIWLEAEKTKYHVTTPSSVRIQERREMKNFNLWTGKAQVLFTATPGNDAITFDITAPCAGEYRVAAVVTRGADYGSYSAQVNGLPATIHYQLTKQGPGTRNYQVEQLTTSVFDAHPVWMPGNGPSTSNALDTSRQYVVTRINLGVWPLHAGLNTISLHAVNPTIDGKKIGVDQLILTAIKDDDMRPATNVAHAAQPQTTSKASRP